MCSSSCPCGDGSLDCFHSCPPATCPCYLCARSSAPCHGIYGPSAFCCSFRGPAAPRLYPT
ncbi:hypothetical protein B0H17DRAFT_1050837 [Mycena rosella]|uniref:Uncharacterized protein n=1 Tax=Mycena rosella TaxID=1033263 RepID=A0AAD7DRZ2_MYCRO|nr:hypothetical protein B0H17DRAFT_1050837 [Mycena rosella]